MKTLLGSCLLLLLVCGVAAGEDTSAGDAMMAEYFAAETARINAAPLAGVKSLEDWEAKRTKYREQLYEMLGLSPLPERTDLRVTQTGTIERDGVVVEKLHFQSSPGLYVTANLYRPAGNKERLPAVLYVCGHGRVKKDGISYGNKTNYQHHGAWFARHGFVCLTIDTLQLGEIEGEHQGTYNDKGRWWNNRGYTPAGVEAWNSIRALDLLESREDVDPKRIGVTGRSGGGAYSWWISALDERIQAAVPVAGITDLQNHVVDGVVSGHCDCMFWVNTYQHDYALLPALVAPRPLLIANTDTDPIFPLDGVNRVFFSARDIYRLYGKAKNLGLTIIPGGHKDTQPLRVPAFYWLREHLQGEAPLIEVAATKLFEVEELKVFDELPEDQINTRIQELFVPAADLAKVPESKEQWNEMRDAWRSQLMQKSLGGWPKEAGDLNLKPVKERERGDWSITQYEFVPQENIRLPLLAFKSTKKAEPKSVRLIVADEAQWQAYADALKKDSSEDSPLAETNPEELLLVVAPRGIGPTKWSQEKKTDVNIRRRFLLLGQSMDGMRAWDIRRAVHAASKIVGNNEAPITVEASDVLAGVAVYATIFEPQIDRLVMHNPPADHQDGPILLNVRRFMNMPEAVAMAAEKAEVVVDGDDGVTAYAKEVAQKLGWPKDQIQAGATLAAGS